MKNKIARLLILLSALNSWAGNTSVLNDHGRIVLNFNQGWRFLRLGSSLPVLDKRTKDNGEADASFLDYDDTSWDLVNVPHTVQLEPWNASGGRNFQGLCWYRKHFIMDPGWKGKKMFLTFEGAMQVAEVWINGCKMTTHYGGYLPFVLDVTEFVKFNADNVVALRLDNRNQPLVPPGQPQANLDFCYFGGLYRDVTFTVTDRLHITDPIFANKPAGGGILVNYPDISEASATVQVKTEVINESNASRNCQVQQSIVDADGQEVASIATPVVFDSGVEKTLTQELKIFKPKLWHPYHPNLYTLLSKVVDGTTVVDSIATRIGLRSFEFKTNNLYINGEKFYSFGANHHQDYVYIGNAVPDSLQRQDVKLMREAGMTSFRSHYPHSVSFMDSCDELGLLTIVSTPGWNACPSDPIFWQRVQQDNREMIRWNRNRPSVILWEIGLNEAPYSKAYAQEAQRITHNEFPFAPCYTVGDSYNSWQVDDPVFDVIYNSVNAKRFPLRVKWTRESGDFQDMNWRDQVSDNRVSRAMGEYAMLLQAKAHMSNVRWTPGAGQDLWAAIDCDRGYHPIPFLGGFLDKARLPKFDFYMFASQRPPSVRVPGLNDGPMVFIANLMNHYSPRDVTIFSNCEEVRLLKTEPDRNSKSMVDPKPEVVVGVQRVKVNSNGTREPVVFEAALKNTDGVHLKAQGLISGQVVAENTVSAPGVPRKLILKIEGGRSDRLVADGSDIIAISASISDQDNNIVTIDDRSIKLSVSGAGIIIGDGAIEANPCRSVLGVASFLVQSTPQAGTISIRATAQGLSPGELVIHSEPLQTRVVEGRDVGKYVIKNINCAPISSGMAVQPDLKTMEEQKQAEDTRNVR